MRVTHTITRLIVGGAQENTAYSVIGLRKKPDLHVDLISGPSIGPEGSLEGLFAGIPGVLRVVPELVRPVQPWLDFQALRKLTAIFKAEKPDLVHTHSGKAGVVGRLAAARAGVPIIVHTIHGPSFGPFQGAVANTVFAAAEKYAARVTTHFVVVADAMRDQYLARGIGKPEQYTKIFSGFELEPFLNAKNDPELRRTLGLSVSDMVIGKIARLTDLKGHDDLVESARNIVANCSLAKFLLIGDGELRPEIEKRVRELGLADRFIFTGLVKPSEVPRYVGVMDIVTHFSRREGLPRALPQALAAGKPVVAFDCDGSREACIDGQTGFLVRTGDRHGLTSQLSLLCKDEALRQKLGSQGRDFVVTRFGVQKMVDDLHDLYLRLKQK